MDDGELGTADYGFSAEFYDHVPTYRERPDVAFYVSEALSARGLVLEVGCGTGRVVLPTARAGVDIVGLDLSAHMLRVCRSRLSEEPADVQARVQLTQGDMREFSLSMQFSLVTLPFRSFQHLVTAADQVACLTTIRRHLAPGGRLILDLFNPSLPLLADQAHGEEWGGEPEALLPDGRRVLRRFRIAGRDYFNQVQDTEIIYYVTHTDGRQERLVHRFPLRYLFRFETEHLLARCGYQIECLYADYSRSPYGSIYPGDLIFLASA